MNQEHIDILNIDECGFNLNNTNNNYIYEKKGKLKAETLVENKQ